MRVRIAIEVDTVKAALHAYPEVGRKVGKEVLGTITSEIAAAARPLAPKLELRLEGSIRATRPVATARGVISAGVVAGGPGLLAKAGRGASAHVRAWRAHALASRSMSVYAAVQEVGHQRTRSGAVVELHSHTGQAHFIEVPALRLAPLVPHMVLAGIDREVA